MIRPFQLDFFMDGHLYSNFCRNSYIEKTVLRHHNNYVSCICLLDDGAFICTGSNDKTIAVYATGSNEPVMILKQHTQNGMFEWATYTLVNFLHFSIFLPTFNHIFLSR